MKRYKIPLSSHHLVRLALATIWFAHGLAVADTAVYGLGGFRPVYPPGPNDLVGVRYRFKVVENKASSLRLIFNFNRLHTPGSSITYLLESNVYSGRLTFTDGGCTTWPLLGSYIEAESSLRIAMPDWVFHLNQQPGITTGLLTRDSTAFPIQTYLIDNIPKLYKSDAICQFSLNGLEAEVSIERGETLTDVSAFTRCERKLLPGTYRKWLIRTEIEGRKQVIQEAVALDSSARYLTVNEALNFASEFIHKTGPFVVQFWGFKSIRESDAIWRQLTDFTVNDNYDGNGSNFGVHLVKVGNDQRVEISNQPGHSYFAKNTHFSISPTSASK